MADENGGEGNQQDQQGRCIFFRKPLKNKNIRRKRDEELAECEDEACGVVMKKKQVIPPDNRLHFATAGWSSNRSEKAWMFQLDSSKEIQVHNDCRATATLETETETSRDARAIRERMLKRAAAEQGKGKGKGKGEEKKLYKGISGYTDHRANFRREGNIVQHGPSRAALHIRTTARFDYQPDVCKDYKETGYCGYGDSCKFLHDRGDFKSGWLLEKEWDESQKEKKRKLVIFKDDDDDDDKDDDDGLPFACFICRHQFVNPVVTKCKHYFCEQCALKHHRMKKTCFVCNRPTLGIFDTAHEIRKKMSKNKGGRK